MMLVSCAMWEEGGCGVGPVAGGPRPPIILSFPVEKGEIHTWLHDEEDSQPSAPFILNIALPTSGDCNGF